jgi:drug/metabolite transporter (DMT)-like permease
VTALLFFLVALSEGCAIAGQIFFKLAMGRAWGESRVKASLTLLAGVVAMAFGFFIWLGLLGKFDLSFLYPFESVSRLVLLLATVIFLKEKISLRLWLGVLLISAGVAVVALS